MPDDKPRIVSTPADVLQLLMDQMDRDCREKHPGAFRQVGDIVDPPPEDDEAMPPHEWAVRKKMLELNEIPQHHHQASAMLWERISELAQEAANAEWRLLQAGSTAREAE